MGKMPAKLKKVASRKFFSPTKDFPEREGSVIKFDHEEIIKLRNEISQINEGMNKVMASVNTKVTGIVEKNNCEIFKKIHQMETDLLKETKQMNDKLGL